MVFRLHSTLNSVFNIENDKACKCKELFWGVSFVILFMTDNAVSSCVTELFYI